MEEKVVFKRPALLENVPLHYCPGCTHGIVHRLIAETLEELGVTQENVIGVAPVGCAVFAYDYFTCDMAEAAHGRAPSVATGIKRVHPDKVVFSYQGDGDLASIGMAETVHAAARNENFTVIFINNSIYGMTGGQMAPTTLLGQYSTTSQHGRDPKLNGYPIHVSEMLSQLVGPQYSTTSQHGRDPKLNGYPIHVSEMLSQLVGPQYIERVSTHDAAHVLQAKKAIKKAFQYQLEGKGFSMVEVLVACPTNWKMTPDKAVQYIKDEVMKFYPLGVYKDRG